MKIALIHTRLVRRGGLETRLFSYIDYLHKLGHEVSVICSKVAPDANIPDGVEILPVSMATIPKPVRGPSFDKKVHETLLRNKFDFVLSLTRTTHQDALLAPANHLGFVRATGKKILGVKDRLDIKMERRAFASPGSILAASEMMRDELIELYQVKPAKIKLLLPPVDPQRFHHGVKQRREEFRQKYEFHPDKTSFLFISASHKRKGLPLLLKVFEALQDEPVELIVAGVKPPKTKLTNVRYVGYVKEAEELYSAADYFLLPALFEPFGQVVSEALLCNVPVVLSHMVGAKTIVGDAEGVVVNGFDPQDWIDTLRSLKERHFSISADFAIQKRIRLEDHMEGILELARVAFARKLQPVRGR
ncbi:MAG: glycosyltransferase family 4 protein [Calditrichia bacterium]